MTTEFVPEQPQLLELPFDQYQRYKIVQEIVTELRPASRRLRILDVGGSPSTLKGFLPDDLVVVADMADQGGLDVYSDGGNLPFAVGAFDIVVAIDTLEHIPPQNREGFVNEIQRVSSSLVIIGAPFNDEQVVRAEEVFQQMIWARYGEGYYFIEEHRTYGLPELDAVLEWLHAGGYITAVLPNGYLHRWLAAISTFFLLQWRFHDSKLSRLANAYYNANFYRQDNREPCYRRVIVASKEGHLEGLQEKLCQPPAIDAFSQANSLQAIVAALQVIGESWSEKALSLQGQLVELHQAFDRQLAEERGAFAGQLADLVRSRDAFSEALQFKEAELLNSSQEYERILHGKEEEIQQKSAELVQASSAYAELLEQTTQERERLVGEVGDKDRLLEEQKGVIQSLNGQLLEIYSSTAWSLIRYLWRLRLWLVPHFSRRERLIYGIKDLLQGKKSKATEASVVSSVTGEPAELLPEFSAPASMAASYDVILFPIIDWDFRFQRPQQMARILAQKGRRVFYLRTRFGQQLAVRPTRMADVYEVTLPGPTGLNLYQDCLEADVLSQVEEALLAVGEHYRIQEAVCVVDLPFWQPLADRMRERQGWKLVYDCMDHYAGFVDVSSDMLALEKTLSGGSDLVLASARRLYDEQSQLNPNCLFLPNAGQFDHFNTVPEQIPAELREISRPCIGYYGAISTWFDSGLVARLAQERLGWSFILVGSTWGAELEPVRGLKNVYLLGEKPYEILPAYLHQFDVCFIPFLKTPLTDATNPVKMFEYLSAGKPVVATDLDELRNYQDQLYLVSSPNDWLPMLEKALKEDSKERVEKRIEFARQNTWKQRAEQMDMAILALYPRTSILIVTYNNLEYTRQCLESVFQNTSYPNFEVIVVDNASSDGTQKYLQSLTSRYPNLLLKFNDENAGFARANNQAAGMASGEILIFLNNDTIVPYGWLTRLLRHLNAPEIGIVGPVTNFSGNESRIDVPYADVREVEDFAEERYRLYRGKSFEFRVAALFCAAVRRSDFEKAGGLDERYGIGMFEDDDLAESIRRLGRRIICAEDTFVHHWGMASFKKLDSDVYQKLFEENRQKFESKWGFSWTPHAYRVQNEERVEP